MQVREMVQKLKVMIYPMYSSSRQVSVKPLVKPVKLVVELVVKLERE
jgi:hypothetical protein